MLLSRKGQFPSMEKQAERWRCHTDSINYNRNQSRNVESNQCFWLIFFGRNFGSVKKKELKWTLSTFSVPDVDLSDLSGVAGALVADAAPGVPAAEGAASVTQCMGSARRRRCVRAVRRAALRVRPRAPPPSSSELQLSRVPNAFI